MQIQTELTNWIIKLTASQSGKIVRLFVGFFIAALAKKELFPGDTLESLQLGLEQAGVALAMAGFAWFEVWLSERKKAGVKVVQHAINTQLPESLKIAEDGLIGNKTLKVFTGATGITLKK